MKQNQHYSPEFKARAAELLATGMPVQELAEELRISAGLLYSWRASMQKQLRPVVIEKMIQEGWVQP
ncbi:MAG: Transposase [Verrucomicrobiales bacterium]|nr:Transposase [Verrucomicrobiales bacterium]